MSTNGHDEHIGQGRSPERQGSSQNIWYGLTVLLVIVIMLGGMFALFGHHHY